MHYHYYDYYFLNKGKLLLLLIFNKFTSNKNEEPNLRQIRFALPNSLSLVKFLISLITDDANLFNLLCRQFKFINKIIRSIQCESIRSPCE